MLRIARNTIECAFGRLKARWAFFRKTIDMQIETVPNLIYSCFVLHNFCERNNRCGIDQEVQPQTLLQRKEDKTTPNTPDEFYSHNTTEGENVCEILAKYIVENLPGNYST